MADREPGERQATMIKSRWFDLLIGASIAALLIVMSAINTGNRQNVVCAGIPGTSDGCQGAR